MQFISIGVELAPLKLTSEHCEHIWIYSEYIIYQCVFKCCLHLIFALSLKWFKFCYWIFISNFIYHIWIYVKYIMFMCLPLINLHKSTKMFHLNFGFVTSKSHLYFYSDIHVFNHIVCVCMFCCVWEYTTQRPKQIIDLAWACLTNGMSDDSHEEGLMTFRMYI